MISNNKQGHNNNNNSNNNNKNNNKINNKRTSKKLDCDNIVISLVLFFFIDHYVWVILSIISKFYWFSFLIWLAVIFNVFKFSAQIFHVLYLQIINGIATQTKVKLEVTFSVQTNTPHTTILSNLEIVNNRV